MNTSRILIITPTYNEQQNIAPFCAEVFGKNQGKNKKVERESGKERVDLLFVDDRGSDDTATTIKRLQNEQPRIHLLQRPHRAGLGTAYVDGFKWGMQRGYEYFITMDADLSHNPRYLRTICKLLQEHDVVVGSRYVSGGGTENCAWHRRLLSRLGSAYARAVLALKIQDVTSGFVGFRREALARINLSSLKSEGFVFQVETKYRAHRAGCRLVETPIVFADRVRGKSKMSAKIALEGAIRCLLLRWHC